MGLTDTSEETLKAAIRAEVEEFNHYLAGECYGYEVVGAGGEVLDSCWGFLGDLDYVRSEAKAQASAIEDPEVQRRADELAARATYAAG